MGNPNLAGVEAAVADKFVRVELARADVPAYRASKRFGGEVKATIAGFLHFRGGPMVTFSRAWYYWVVRLSKPVSAKAARRLNLDWGKVIRVDGYAGGTEPSEGGVDVYHVDSQAGLNRLVQFLIELYGEPEDRLPDASLGVRYARFLTILSKHVGGSSRLYFVAPPCSSGALARMEIEALQMLKGPEDYVIANGRNAIELALRAFGPRSRLVREARLNLSARLSESITRKIAYAPGSKRVSDRYCHSLDIFKATSLQIDTLWAAGRRKEAGELKKFRAQISPVMIADIERYFSAVIQELAEYEKSGAGESFIDTAIYHCAYSSWWLGTIFRSLGMRAEAGKVFRRARHYAERLSPGSAANYYKYTRGA